MKISIMIKCSFLSVETNLSNATNKFYPLQRVELRCIRPVRDGVIEGEITWIVNKMNPALDPARYSIVNNGSTLIVRNVSEYDTGESHTSFKWTASYISLIGVNCYTVSFKCMNKQTQTDRLIEYADTLILF